MPFCSGAAVLQAAYLLLSASVPLGYEAQRECTVWPLAQLHTLIGYFFLRLQHLQ